MGDRRKTASGAARARPKITAVGAEDKHLPTHNGHMRFATRGTFAEATGSTTGGRRPALRPAAGPAKRGDPLCDFTPYCFHPYWRFHWQPVAGRTSRRPLRTLRQPIRPPSLHRRPHLLPLKRSNLQRRARVLAARARLHQPTPLHRHRMRRLVLAVAQPRKAA